MLKACPKAVFCNSDSIEAVNLAAYLKAAMVMLAFGHTYLAADQQGVTLVDRARFMQERNLLTWQVL